MVTPSFHGHPVAPLRLVLAADVRLYLEALVARISPIPRFSVALASSRAEALARVRDFAPRVLVVDIAMREGLDIIRDVRKQSNATKVLAFAVDDTSSDVVACAEAGAAGYVPPDVGLDGLVDAIERVAKNELVCSPRAAVQLFRRISEPRPPDRPGLKDLSRLTTREAEVLDFISQGHSNKQIAAELNISESTVKNHVHHLLEKLAVTTRAQAAARALRHLGRHHSSRFATVRNAHRP